MSSSFLCVIVIGLLFQVFAQDQFHSKIWWTNLQKMKMNEENNRNALVDSEHPTPPPPPRMSLEKIKINLLCADKTGVSPETILSIKEGDWKDDDPKAKAWVQCVLVENKLMTDQSVFRLDVAFKHLSGLEKQSIEEKIDMCLPTKKMPPVEISWKFAKCFQTADQWNSLF